MEQIARNVPEAQSLTLCACFMSIADAPLILRFAQD